MEWLERVGLPGSAGVPPARSFTPTEAGQVGAEPPCLPYLRALSLFGVVEGESAGICDKLGSPWKPP